jgi:hypothetical protein
MIRPVQYLSFSALVYGVILLYLVGRGVGPRRIAGIMRAGIVASLWLAIPFTVAAYALGARSPQGALDAALARGVAAALVAGLVFAAARGVRHDIPGASDDKVERAGPGLMAVALALAVLAGIGVLFWTRMNPLQDVAMVDRATGIAVDTKTQGPFFAYPEIDGPPPGDRLSAEIHTPAEGARFSAWLEKKRIPWKLVHVQGRGKTYLMWDPGEGHDRLESIYRRSVAASHIGLDFYRMEVIAPRAPAGYLERQRFAAFDGDEQRERFEGWLRARGVEPQAVQYAGHEFITWSSPEAEPMLSRYLHEMRELCVRVDSAAAAADRTKTIYPGCSTD